MGSTAGTGTRTQSMPASDRSSGSSAPAFSAGAAAASASAAAMTDDPMKGNGNSMHEHYAQYSNPHSTNNNKHNHWDTDVDPSLQYDDRPYAHAHAAAYGNGRGQGNTNNMYNEDQRARLLTHQQMHQQQLQLQQQQFLREQQLHHQHLQQQEQHRQQLLGVMPPHNVSAPAHLFSALGAGIGGAAGAASSNAAVPPKPKPTQSSMTRSLVDHKTGVTPAPVVAPKPNGIAVPASPKSTASALERHRLTVERQVQQQIQLQKEQLQRQQAQAQAQQQHAPPSKEVQTKTQQQHPHAEYRQHPQPQKQQPNLPQIDPRSRKPGRFNCWSRNNRQRRVMTEEEEAYHMEMYGDQDPYTILTQLTASHNQLQDKLTHVAQQLRDRQHKVELLEKQIRDLSSWKTTREALDKQQRDIDAKDALPVIRNGELDLQKDFPSVEQLKSQYQQLQSNISRLNESFHDEATEALPSGVLEKFFFAVISQCLHEMHQRSALFQWQSIYVLRNGGSIPLPAYTMIEHATITSGKTVQAELDIVGPVLLRYHRLSYSVDVIKAMCKPYVKQVLNTTLPQLLQYAVFGKPSEAISAALDALVLEILEFCWCCTVSNPQLLFVAAEVESPMNHNDHQPIRLSDHSHSIVKSNIYPALILAATKTSDRTVVSRGLVRLH